MTYIVRLSRPDASASADQYRTPSGWHHAPVLGRGFSTRRYAVTIANRTKLLHPESVVTIEEHKST